MSSSCFIKRALPFALAFLCGVAVWQLLGVKLQVVNDVLRLEHGPRSCPGERGGTWAYALTDEEMSRTWLVIRPSPAVAPSSVKARDCDGCSVRMRVLLGENGAAVPGNGFSLSSASYPLIDDAVAAARRVAFTPATRNGRRIPIWVNATYSCSTERFKPSTPDAYLCSLSIDKDSARTWDGRPWRVVTTHE